MTVKDIVIRYLQANGYGGLCNDEDCSCSIEDWGLAPCCCDHFNVMNCSPGHKSRCYDKECDCQGFHISAEKPVKGVDNAQQD